MSANEEMFKKFLEQNKIEYVVPTKDNCIIDNVPFNKSKTYKADFYLPKKDLFIEIKGFMTLYAVNKLIYLLEKRLPNNFCILQMTEEEWIKEISEDKNLKSASGKLQKSIQQQFSEIKTLDSKKLHDLSQKRLKEYIATRKAELDFWLAEK